MNRAFQNILEEYDQITENLLKGDSTNLAKLGKRQAELLPLVEKIQTIHKLEQEIVSNQDLLDSDDEQIKVMALEDIRNIESQILDLTTQLETDLIPKDPKDNNTALLEIRAGAGGDEATLFAAEIFRAYSKFAEKFNWQINIVSSSKSEAGGFKEIICEIRGKPNPIGPYGIFKYESGVHRVQRVPETEKSGRVHTSTITVAVLPEIKEQDFSIDPKDLKIEATTSSGAGGQSVNTTYSAIRIVHIPTGIVATCQDERSQAQNKEKAMAVIRARVSDYYQRIETEKITSERRNQIGTGDRSEKIRTYNFAQDRVTDHRINTNFNQINLIMEGYLQDIIANLQKAEAEAKKTSLNRS